MSLISRQRLKKKKDGKRDESMEQNLSGKAVLWRVHAIFLSINRLKKNISWEEEEIEIFLVETYA